MKVVYGAIVMREGWHGNQYLILFELTEIPSASQRYDLPRFLPGYDIVGLRGWDDFIVQDADGNLFTVPTVPLEPRFLKPLELDVSCLQFEPVPRVARRIKWYVTPIVFGGDTSLEANVIWIDLAQHAQLVKWWNNKYHEVSGS